MNPCGEPGHVRLLLSEAVLWWKKVACQSADPAGLNPHAGEQGLCEKQEAPEIAPAVGHAEHEGLLTRGPLPREAVFSPAWKKESEIVVAMYHDQGHIASKMVGFEDAVNVTAGLLIVRTSVDHGTAFDIAGKKN